MERVASERRDGKKFNANGASIIRSLDRTENTSCSLEVHEETSNTLVTPLRPDMYVIQTN